MMNALAIALVLTSLVTASVWSPSPPHHDDPREVIVKEGHRVVVVEYDKEADGSTKVLISPQDDSKDSSNEENHASGMFSGPRELVCDAYGKCKHKIATALGKTKDQVEEAAHEAVHGVGESLGKAKEGVSQGIDKAKGGVAQGVDKAKKVAGDVAETVKDGAQKVKNLDVVGSTKTLGGDIGRNATSIEETVEEVTKGGEKSFGEILKKLKDVMNDVMWYMVSRDKINAVAGLIHMLGFSTAYGTCVWVTFISSYILGRHLPKQQFGMVQSRIYPVYFKAMAYSITAALLGHLASRKGANNLTGLIGFPGSSLLAALGMVLANMIFLEPRATKTMYERMKIEKEEGRGVAGLTRDGLMEAARERVAEAAERPTANVQPVVVTERQDVVRLNEKLKRLNTYSSALNLSTLVALTWHMAHLGTRLHATR